MNVAASERRKKRASVVDPDDDYLGLEIQVLSGVVRGPELGIG